MALDFFGVMLAGRIVLFPRGSSGKSETVELWTEPVEIPKVAGVKVPTTQKFKALSFVSQVNLELRLGDNAKLQVVLTPPYEDGLQLLQSELVRFGTGRLEVEIGYTTGTADGQASQLQTLPFFGLLQKPDVSIGTDVTITLNALGVGYAMTTVGGKESKAYDIKKSPAEIVELVLKKYVDGKYTGIDIKDLYSSVTPEQRKEDPFFQPANDHNREFYKKVKPNADETAISIVQGPRNDWWFIRETIENFGYDLFIQGHGVYIAKKTDWLNRTKGFGDSRGPRKHFKLRGNVDPYINMFPILSFQSPTTGVWMENGLGCQDAKDISEDKSGASGSCASAKTHDITQVKEKSGLDPDKPVYTNEPNEVSQNVPVNPNSAEGRAKLAGEWRNTMMQSGIQGEFQTLGVPGLRPGEVVQVSGFEYQGQPDSEQVLFNGPYGVINVRHSVGVGGFTTNFLGVMNFFPKAFIEAATKTTGDKVDSEPLPPSGQVGNSGQTTKVSK